MPTILISTDLAETQKEIIEGTARTLSYRTIGPEILPEIGTRYDLPADALAAALETPPSAWRWKQSRRWLYYLACIEAEVLERLKTDNIVCWGLAAHLYVQGVSHAFKVRLVSDREQRITALAEDSGMSRARAERSLASADRRREQWSLAAFGQSELNPSLHDLVINLGQIAPDEAIQTVCGAVSYRKFQPMTYSMKSLEGNALAAKVKAKLLASLTDIRVQAIDGRVVVTSKAMKRERRKKAAAIKEIAGAVEGVEYVEVHLINYVIREAAESLR